jgi:membrane protein YqaA with SNARE-associated domain
VTPSALCISTFVAALLGSFLPFGSTELVVLSAAALMPPHFLLPLAVGAALGQMIAKSVLYFAGRGLVRLPGGRFARAAQGLQAHASCRNTSTLVLLVSATTGFPPFYLLTIAAGSVRVPFARFLTVGLCGRLIRFAFLVGVPHALKSAL